MRAFAIPAVLLCAVGCSGNPDAVTPEGTVAQSRLSAVYSLHTTFLEKKGRTPTDAAELRVFGENLPTAQGGPVVLTAEFLVSPRDKQPIVVRYGLPLMPKAEGDGPVLAHETTGVNGRRFVVYATSGRIEEVDAGRMKELVP